jgi:hypothetical protein
MTPKQSEQEKQAWMVLALIAMMAGRGFGWLAGLGTGLVLGAFVGVIGLLMRQAGRPLPAAGTPPAAGAECTSRSTE